MLNSNYKFFDLKKITSEPLNLFRIGLSLISKPFRYVSIITISELLKTIGIIGLLYENTLLTLCFPVFTSLIDMKVRNYCNHINMEVIRNWESVTYGYFFEISYEDKVNYQNMMDFKDQVYKTGWALCRLVTWGFSTFIEIFVIMLNCVIIVVKKKYYNVFIIFPVAFLSYYRFIMKSRQKKLSLVRDQKKKMEQELQPVINWYLQLFKHSKKSTESIISLQDEIHNTELKFISGWDLICTEMILISKTIGFLCLIFNVTSFADLLVSKIIFDQLVNSTENIANFTNNLVNNIRDFDRFIEWIHSVNRKSNFSFTPTIIYPLEIKEININLGMFSLECKELYIEKHDKILLRGVSGSGKTKLVQSLQGFIPGCVYKRFDSKSTEDWWEFMNQETRESIPSAGISIRQLLENEDDDSYIFELINLVELNYLFNKDDLDKILKNLSGGEKMRLSLLYTLWERKKRKKSIVIFDEPEQGLDEDTRIGILHNILVYLSDIPVLFIFHGSKLDLLELSFTKVWEFSKDKNHSFVNELKWSNFRNKIIDKITTRLLDIEPN